MSTNNYPVPVGHQPTVGQGLMELALAIDGLTDAILVIGIAQGGFNKKQMAAAVAKAGKHTDERNQR